MKDLFTPLIQGLCSIYKLDVRHVLAGKTIEIQGVRFFLRHHQEELSTLVLLYCDFGALPQEHETALYRMMLQSNLQSFTGEGEAYSLTPDNHVVFVRSFSLEMITPALLSAHMALISMRAQNWLDEALAQLGLAEPAVNGGVNG
ncbi:MAG: CesT family type III secretion system chaperone [Janthinobacterium lividum]